jgi:hypothetical protein
MPLHAPSIGPQRMPHNVRLTVEKKQQTLKHTVMALPHKFLVCLGRTLSGPNHDYLMLQRELPPALDGLIDSNVRVD